MVKNFIFSGVLVYATNIISSIGDLIYFYLLIGFLNDSELGIYYSIFSLMSLLNIFASSGLGNYLMIDFKKKFTDRTFFILKIAFIIASLSLIIVPIYTILYKKIFINFLSLLFLIIQPIFMLITTIIGAILQRTKNFVKYSIFRIFTSISKFSFFLLFLKIYNGFDAALLSSSLMYIIPNLFFIKYLLKFLNFKKIFKFSTNYGKNQQKIGDLKYFSKYYLLSFLTSGIIPGFIFISSFLLEDSIIGIVSAINVFPQLIWALSSSALFIIFPYMIESKTKNDFFLISIKLMAIIAVPSYILLNFGFKYLLVILNIENRFSDYSILLLYLSLFWFLKLMTDLFQRYYIVNKEFKLIFRSYFFGYVFSTILFFILILFTKKYALPLTYIIAISSIFLYYSLKLMKNMDNKMQRKNLIKTVIGIPVSFILSYIVLIYIEMHLIFLNDLFLQIIVSFLTFLIVSLILVTVFIFNRKDFFNLWNMLKREK
ncbi:hypothetical protein LCGC14_1362340 [marine sediment metagenome]|uniref:Uncharacterized protein n=1 Tax=marine sediment metagenome TaxID=412755 RepID=A0A0F9N9W7_9ZZZZ